MKIKRNLVRELREKGGLCFVGKEIGRQTKTLYVQ